MARRGKEQALQEVLDSQVEWEDMLSKEGLCVIDVYQSWCGFTQGMTQQFKKVKNEIGDPLLRFAVAKADTIDALEKYRGRCEPCFLFFAGGVLVAVVRSANAPLILRTITEQLAQEHKVLDGQAERKEIKDTVIAQLEAKEKAKSDEEEREKEEEGEKKKEVMVAIIKPDAVKNGKAEEIMMEMAAREIEILRQEERHLTEEEVRTLYSHLQDEDYFEDIVKFMSSSPCIVLAITKGETGENIIKEFRDLIGPPKVDQAKEEAPESLRAKYGSDTVQNAVHAADSHETAIRELAFFFPDFVAPTVTVQGKPKLQRTLALIRPDAYKAHKDEIISKIRESGFRIAMKKEVHLSKEQAEDFYSEHKDLEYFDELTTRMSSGPLLALGLARKEAVDGWRQMLGPKIVEKAKEEDPECLRAKYAVEGTPINMLHGSSTEENAKKELEYFFPVEQTMAVIKPDAYQTKDEIIDKIHEAGFRIAARKETTLSKEIAEEFYRDHKDKEYFDDLVSQMSSGPTYFMVLSREGAVEGWRTMIGETDPDKAKQADPESIRGQFGTDILKNAVHGSSNVEHAMSTIQQIFGELYFNPDGTVQERKEDTQEDKQATQEQQAEVKEDTQEPQRTEQVEGEKEPEAQAEPEPEQQQEKVKTPEPQQESEEKKEEQEPQKESTGEGDAQQQQEQAKEEVKEEQKEEETTQEEAKEEPAHKQEESQEESQEKQQEPEPEPAQTSEEQSEQKTETTEETTEQKTEEQKTDEQKSEETADEKKEDAT